jgi:hypothetical protein
MKYVLITVAPSGTMTAKPTDNYMQAKAEVLDEGWSAFVVEVKSFQINRNPYPGRD